MDPVSIGSTIVGFVITWIQERQSQKDASLQEFVEWVRRHDHQQVADAIERNHEISQAIEQCLDGNHAEVLAQLKAVEGILIDVASRLARVGPIAEAVAIESGISDQAVSILMQMNAATASTMLLCRTMSDTTLMYLDRHVRGGPDITEERFLLDDLETLCRFGFLTQDYNGSGDPIFRLTRAGAAFADASLAAVTT